MADPVCVGAIDCGTNSIRLLIADVPADGTPLIDVVREMRIVRLGEGVDRTGEFSAAALDRVFAACDEYAALLAAHPVAALRFVATSASRDVSNRGAFVDGVRARLGVEPQVISGEEEAGMSFLGAVRGLPPLAAPVLVVDIGGGSTEFILGGAEASSPIRASISVDVGCVRMTERHLSGDPPTPAQVDAVQDDLAAALTRVGAAVPIREAATVVGVAGTVTTVAAMARGLDSYDPTVLHGAVVTTAQVEEVTDRLLAMTHAERAALPFMHPGRVDVIAGGAMVLRAVVRAIGCPEVIASETDILDGIAYRLAS